MKKVIAVLFTLFLVAPMVAAAEQPAEAQPAVDATVESVEAPAETPQTLEDLLTPETTAVQQGPNCCQVAETQCENNCRRTGVFEFSCDPDTCSSSCICNIG